MRAIVYTKFGSPDALQLISEQECFLYEIQKPKVILSANHINRS